VLACPGGTCPDGRSDPITRTQSVEHVIKMSLKYFWWLSGDHEAETVSADDAKVAHRLQPEERMLLVILYIRSLALDSIVDYIMGTPLPSDRPRIKEYNELQRLHKQLRARLAEAKSKHQRYKQNLEEQNEFYYFPPQKRMSSQPMAAAEHLNVSLRQHHSKASLGYYHDGRQRSTRRCLDYLLQNLWRDTQPKICRSCHIHLWSKLQP